MLHIAMLGLAHVHADGYARQIVNHPEAEIVCVWDDDEARGHAAAEKYSVAYARDLEAVLSREDVDAVVVNAPTVQHKDILLAAVAHLKHLYRESTHRHDGRRGHSGRGCPGQQDPLHDLATQPHPLRDPIPQEGPRCWLAGPRHDDAGAHRAPGCTGSLVPRWDRLVRR